MSEATPTLDDAAFLRAFLDLVIPPGRGMPGAGDLDLRGGLAAAAAGDVASLEAALGAVQRAARERDPGGLAALSPAAAKAVVDAAQAANPMLMFTVCRFVYLAYYQHPAVLTALGEPARPPFPEGYELEPLSPDLQELLESRRIR